MFSWSQVTSASGAPSFSSLFGYVSQTETFTEKAWRLNAATADLPWTRHGIARRNVRFSGSDREFALGSSVALPSDAARYVKIFSTTAGMNGGFTGTIGDPGETRRISSASFSVTLNGLGQVDLISIAMSYVSHIGAAYTVDYRPESHQRQAWETTGFTDPDGFFFAYPQRLMTRLTAIANDAAIYCPPTLPSGSGWRFNRQTTHGLEAQDDGYGLVRHTFTNGRSRWGNETIAGYVCRDTTIVGRDIYAGTFYRDAIPTPHTDSSTMRTVQVGATKIHLLAGPTVTAHCGITGVFLGLAGSPPSSCNVVVTGTKRDGSSPTVLASYSISLTTYTLNDGVTQVAVVADYRTQSLNLSAFDYLTHVDLRLEITNGGGIGGAGNYEWRNTGNVGRTLWVQHVPYVPGLAVMGNMEKIIQPGLQRLIGSM